MARDFNGSSDKINYTLATGQHSNDAITIAFWAYYDSVAQYANPFRLEDSGAAVNANWEFDDGWGFVFNAQWSSANGAWSIAKPSTGAWVHCCVTYSWSSTANDPVLYINGASQVITERQAPSGTKVNTGDRLVLGLNPSFYLNGRLAEFAIWNRVLTAAEVAQLGDGFAPSVMRRGLVFYDPLLRNTTDAIKGTAGTATGTTVVSHPRTIYPTNYQSRMVPVAAGGSIVLKTLDGLAQASIKTFQGLSSASTKTWNGLSNV